MGTLPNIHILGIQGSGKGTQSALLVKRYGLTYLASGNLFRARAAKGDSFGKELAAQLTTGELLPEDYLIRSVRDFLQEAPLSVGLLGDGVLRTEHQLQALAPLWAEHGLEEPFLIHLTLSEAEAERRIRHRTLEREDAAYAAIYGGKLGKRPDDNPRALHERFALFHQMTEPVIRQFAATDRYAKVAGDQTVEEVFADICAVLESRYPQLAQP